MADQSMKGIYLALHASFMRIASFIHSHLAMRLALQGTSFAPDGRRHSIGRTFRGDS